MLRLYGVAIFLSAALLFLVEPMVGKVLLPLLGGSPAVWNTCLVFFQGLLLLGYLYAHLLTTRVALRWQVLVHTVVMAVAAATLPAPVDVGEPGGMDPRVWVLRTLGLTVGLPFFVIATSGPLLQRWFSRTDHAAAKDPYFLYAASNAGSLVGLLAYPFAVEPWLTRREQAAGWAGGFWVMVPFVIACGAMMLGRAGKAAAAGADVAGGDLSVTWGRRLRWVLWAAVPSSLLLGVTQHMSTDIASIPLLWMIPLTLYLLSFVLAFSGKWGGSARLWGRVLPFVMTAVLLTMLSRARFPVLLILGVHAAAFFVVSMMCHRRLVEDRPGASGLTGFYLAMSLGGVAGGAFNALGAPVLFTTIAEYAGVLGLACFLTPQMEAEWKARAARARLVQVGAGAVVAGLLLGAVWYVDARDKAGALTTWAPYMLARDLLHLDAQTALRVLTVALPTLVCVCVLWRRGSLRFAAGAAALLLTTLITGESGAVLHKSRTFFGVHRVARDPRDHWHTLSHGTTLHGLQATFEPLRSEPTSYYHRTGPLGDVMAMLQGSGRFEHGGFIGLGAGSLAAYGRKGDTLDIFEIDQGVVDIAGDPRCFTYVQDAIARGARLRRFVGDGRLGMAHNPDVPDGTYDLIVVDAFSSDVIPIHLITREAVEMYLTKLRAGGPERPGGVVMFHVSSRYFDLKPVLWRTAKELGLVAWVRDDSVMTSELKGQGKKESVWVALARRDADLGKVATIPTPWERLQPKAGQKTPLWTDDYSNVMDAFVGWGLPEEGS